MSSAIPPQIRVGDPRRSRSRAALAHFTGDCDFDKVVLGASLQNWARKGKQHGHLPRQVETGRSAIADRLSNHAPDTLRWWKEAWGQFGGKAGTGAEATWKKEPPPSKVAGEPYGTKTSEATDAPWRELPGVDKSTLDRLIERFGSQ